MPPTRHPDHPRDREHRRVRLDARRLGPPCPDGAAWRADEQRHEPIRPPARPADVRRLERPDRVGCASAHPAPSAGCRAQRRHHDVGMGHRDRLHPRRDRDRQARPDRERQRTGLRREHLERRARHSRPGDAHRDQPQDPAAGRSGDRTVDDWAVDAGAVAVLWGGADLERPGQPAQPHDGPEGAGLDDVGNPRSSEPRVLPGRVGQQVRAVLPAGEQRAVRGLLRPADRGVRHDRHLFRHAPLAVCRGR